MGGWIVSGGEEIIGTFYAFVTPVKAEIMMRDYGMVSTTAIKIFTKENIPKIDGMYLTYIDYADNIDEKFEILQIADYGKHFMILAQQEGD